MKRALLLTGISLLLLAVPTAAGAPPPAVAPAAGHYLPSTGDRFQYFEEWVLTGESGNYTGYAENQYTNGTVGVTSIAANGTVSAYYSNTDVWENNTGSEYAWTSSGTFTFSSSSFHYVQGTDNQTGYSNPFVWFYMNNSLSPGASFYLLNTQMDLVSVDNAYALPPADHYVKTIFAEGNGSYERNDIYGVFTATYNWQSYFDPSTGYEVGYLYTERDSNPSAGASFDVSDLLYVTNTSYPLTATSAPSGGSSPSGFPESLAILLVVLIVVIAVVLVVVILVRSRRAKLPPHSPAGAVGFGPAPGPPPGVPPPVHLTPSGQPAVQQVVIRETVKVPCRYCGTLIDSTATVCPVCGAPRT